MNNLITALEEVYYPQKALVIFAGSNNHENIYVEAYDMDKDGKPINAHPLSLKEITSLAHCLNTTPEIKNRHLQSFGLMPPQVLYVSTAQQGYVVWQTPAMQASLLFKKELDIPCGNACVPALIWKADKENLWLFAIKKSGRAIETTTLFKAPFFNMHDEGKVCMGTVEIAFDAGCTLESFMSQWQAYFFQSYFSHLISSESPVVGNIVQLWQQQVNTDRQFPTEVLIKAGKTIKNLIV